MLFIAFRNLLRNKLRNILTVLGVCAGIGICATSLSMGTHVRSQVDGILERYQVDLIVQTRGSVIPVQSRLSEKEYQAISQLEGVRHTSAAVVANIRTYFDKMFFIVGISEPDHFFGRVSILEGRWFEPGKNEIILGHLSSRLHDLHMSNKVVLTENHMMTITGIFSLGYNIFDTAAIMDISDARTILNTPDALNLMLIQIEKDTNLQEVMDAIHHNFPHLYASVSTEMADQLGMINYLEFIALVISFISVAICCLVIMNTLFMAISERVREIGVLMALGWSSVRIGSVIVMEGFFLSIVGWCFGLVLGTLFLWWTRGLYSIGAALIPVNISLEVALFTLGLAIITGGLGAIVPAIISLKLSPAEALRHE